jgi:hypothetical protein
LRVCAMLYELQVAIVIDANYPRNPRKAAHPAIALCNYIAYTLRGVAESLCVIMRRVGG